MKNPSVSQQLVQTGGMGGGGTGECVCQWSFLGGCGVMQAGVYGQSLPTAGNTRKKRGPGPASKKGGHPLWEFPSLLL